MNLKLRILVWFCLSILAQLSCIQAAAPKAIEWQPTYDAARAKARKEGKPVIVKFTAEWCGPCKKMDQTTFKDPAVVDALANWVAVKVDVDQNKDLATKFNVQAIPTILIVKSSGGGFTLPPGAMGSKELIAVLKSVK